jgi:hypothetical protein
MDDYLADKIINNFLVGSMTPEKAWRNLQEIKYTICDEKYDEIISLIIEDLINEEVIDEDDDSVSLEDVFSRNYCEDESCINDTWNEDEACQFPVQNKIRG